jgi:hypothetical protein
LLKDKRTITLVFRKDKRKFVARYARGDMLSFGAAENCVPILAWQEIVRAAQLGCTFVNRLAKFAV